jgi:hypothetical protein
MSSKLITSSAERCASISGGELPRRNQGQSCPIPGHADANPSAWVNTEKNVWYCGRCSQGGDVYDLAAFHFGMPVPGYKEGGKFP